MPSSFAPCNEVLWRLQPVSIALRRSARSRSAWSNETPLKRGYVTFGSDSGHEGSNVDGSFALNAEALRNFGGDQLRSQPFADLKGTPYVNAHLLGSIGIELQAPRCSFYQRVFGLAEDLFCQVVRAPVGFLNQLFQKLRGEHARQHRDDEEYEEQWLPVIDWGCAQFSLIDCDDRSMVTLYEGEFHPEDYSFETLQSRWLDGELPALHTGGFYRRSH